MGKLDQIVLPANDIFVPEVPEVDGVIQDWCLEDRGYGTMAWGYLYFDQKNRFPNGTWIHTSKIEDIDGDILRTRNSTYLLGKPKAA